MKRQYEFQRINPQINTVDKQLTLADVRVSNLTANIELPFRCYIESTLPQLVYYAVPSHAKVFFGKTPDWKNAQRANQMMFMPGNISAHLDISGNGHLLNRLVRCDFGADFFVENTNLHNIDSAMLARCGNIASRPLINTMRQIGRELDEPGFGADIAIESLARLALVQLTRLLGKAVDKNPCGGQLASWQLRRIESYLWDAENVWPSINQLAELCGISARHLSRIFSATMKTSLREYVEQIRIARAKKLLTDSQLTRKQIATALGFSSPNNFSVAFHRATGETPSVFCQKSRNH